MTDRVTLISASFNTPWVTLTMLKSFAQRNRGCWPLILSENSTDDHTQRLLWQEEVPFHIYDAGFGLPESLDRALWNCGTEFDTWDQITGNPNNARRIQLREYKVRYLDPLGEFDLRNRFRDGRTFERDDSTWRSEMSGEPPYSSSLDEIFERHVTDKGSVCHNYYTVYESALTPAERRDAKHVLEIGVDRGNSLRAWREWFPNALIVGTDNCPGKLIHGERIECFHADQGDPATLTYWAAARGIQFDIIIDDGSHQPHHQALSMFRLCPWLKPGFHYFIEDYIDPAYLPCFEAMRLTFHDLRDFGHQHTASSMLWHARKPE